MNGQYQNEVPWLVVYEPVVKTYLKERTTVLAFTATEYAMAQKLGYFNFKADKTTAEWGTYEARWIPDWVWHADWESDWWYIPWYEWFFAGNGWEYLYVEHYWKDFGRLGG